jgi:hypothetical protein
MLLWRYRVISAMSNSEYEIGDVSEQPKLQGLRILAKLIAKRLLAKHACDQERGPERP